MRTRIVSAGIGAWLALSAIALAQTGASGQPGVPTGLTTTPDASSSPVPVIPMRPTPHPGPRTSPPPPARTPAPVPAPAPASAPSGPAGVSAVPAPAPPPPETAGEPKRKSGAFWAPYLSDNDVLDRAILDLDAQVKARPDDPGLRNDLGNLLARRGFAKEAVDQYRKASKLDRAFFLADYNEGLVWEKEGKTSSAIHAYERSIKRKPGFPLSRFHLGFLLEREGRADAAIREYAKALRIDPSLRWPARNPIVVQTRLLYRASLVNYERDLAAATLADDSSFADRAVWERLHPQRPVDTSELQPEEEEEPEVVSSGPSSKPLIGGSAAGPLKPETPASRRQQLIDRFRRNRGARPAPNAPPQTEIAPVAPAPPPAAVPAPPPPEDENAPNPAMQQEPPPPVA